MRGLFHLGVTPNIAVRPLLIVFTLTNTVTSQAYVGITQQSPEDRWDQYLLALKLGIDAPLYNDMRKHGSDIFEINEWGYAEDREDLRDLVNEAITDLNAINLQGMKTAVDKPKVVITKKTVTAKAKTSKIKAVTKSVDEKPKMAIGRASSSVKEKAIREGIAREKAEREAEKMAKIAAEADEMKALLANLDARAAGMGRRR